MKSIFGNSGSLGKHKKCFLQLHSSLAKSPPCLRGDRGCCSPLPALRRQRAAALHGLGSLRGLPSSRGALDQPREQGPAPRLPRHQLPHSSAPCFSPALASDMSRGSLERRFSIASCSSVSKNVQCGSSESTKSGLMRVSCLAP